MHDPARKQRGRYRLHPTVDEVTRRRAGEPNKRGRLERHLGPFRLREGLTAPGAMPFAEALDLVLSDWDRQVAEGLVGPEIITAYRSSLSALRLAAASRGRFLVSDIDTNLVLMWTQMPHSVTGQPASDQTSRQRRSAARSFFETARGLGLTDANPAKTIEFPARSERYVHPLTDDQITHVQRLARTTVDDTRTPASFAIVMSGATTTELASLTVDDVDLSNKRVWVHSGGYRQQPRWLPLYDQWCIDAVARRVAILRETYGEDAGSVWLTYQPHPRKPTPLRRPTAVNSILVRLMQVSRVHVPGVTRPESIREWLAIKVYAETGRVEAVALRLGMSSLDAAAHIVGHDWPTEVDNTPPAHRAGDQS